MSSKQILLLLGIICAIALGVLFGVAQWRKILIRESQLISQPTFKEFPKTLIFLEKPNKIHLIKIIDENLQTISLGSFNLPSDIGDFRQIVESRLYFFDKSGIIKYFDLTTKEIKELNFIIKDWGHWLWGGKNFLISPDNKKLVWTVTKYKNLSEEEKQRLEKGETLWPADIKYPERWYVEMWLADLENQNINLLFQKDLTVGEYILPLRWLSSQREIYFLETLTGLGGYAPFRCPPGILYKVGLEKGEVSKVVGEDKEEHYIGFCNFSFDGKLIAYSFSHNLIIKNLVTKEKMVIPIDRKFAYFGNAFFSPDNKFLAYTSALGDPDNEEYTITLVNLSTLEKKEILKGLYFSIAWLDEENLIVQDLNGTTYLVNREDSLLKKISDFYFVGIIE